VTTAVAADPHVAGAVLGRAFTTDPVFRWILSETPRLEQRLTHAFTAFALGATRKPTAHVLVAAEGSAASIWLPPGKWRAPTSEVVRQAPRLLRAYGTRSARALRLLSVVEEQHPTEPHWYLEAIGTVPEARGQGIGPTVMAPVLARCDEAGLPAYLESSNPQNIPFYERHGFVKMPLFELPPGCPVITPMWRVPR
jgi:ribosomal protein S18 acetylase RimI-like enzyme